MKKDTTDKIVELTDKWYRYVATDHHKDKDCHWYVECDFAYGEKPTFRAYHYGYIFEGKEMEKRKTYEEAEKDLLVLIRQAILVEKEWVERVLKDKKEWDETQIEKAELFNKLFKSL